MTLSDVVAVRKVIFRASIIEVREINTHPPLAISFLDHDNV